MAELLEIERVAKTFGAVEPVAALRSVDLAVAKGEFVSIVGPSGCGKSTLLQIIAGLIPASAGEVRLSGRVVREPPEGVVYLFQQYSRSLFPWLTVAENVRFGLRHSAQDRCRELLQMVGLADFSARYPWELSGGMQQRVSIARALAAEPSVLLLDEPFSSVDALTRLELHGLILDLWGKTGLTILLVTHDVEEAVYLSDRIALLTRRPAEVAEVFANALPRPRRPVESREDARFLALRHELLTRLLQPA
ncbi:MAG TPA: ABC transporter ATP-binding protein [Burkholderiales bacterium]|jgi:NitT/TauT family transport system ATP-binding protein|nr:ABC transporter ATP-binding protein [Burkholderiales bacterium]